MPLKLCILGSGSSGNCTYVATERTRILIDAGFSARETVRRLSLIGEQPEGLNGICVSHEHNDHIAGVRVLHRQHGIPLYANSGTVDALRRQSNMDGLPWNIFATGSAFSIGDLHLEPFSVPHDAYEPVGFIVRHEESSAGIVTDLGMATTLIRERLRSCQVLILESNHDEDLLKEAPRPWHLKQRIMGRQGHLSNRGAAEMLREVAGPHLRSVYLAHLSEDCNRQDLALTTARSLLEAEGHGHVDVRLAYPDRVSDVVEV